ncbi:MAG: S8 family serine peptidase [Acidobacteria bacterium]|nr:S8 family serine peptidase [Acidobacteriota bacterium]
MKIIFGLTLLILSLSVASHPQFTSSKSILNENKPDFEYFGRDKVTPNRVLLKFKKYTTQSVAHKLLRLAGDARIENTKILPVFILTSKTKTVSELIGLYKRIPDVEWVQPDYIYEIDKIPNDSHFSQQWGLRNTGLTIQDDPVFPNQVGNPGVDIKAVSAWNISTGNTAQVVAVVDTGIDYFHQDLAENMWSAPASYTVTIGGNQIMCDAGTHGINLINDSCSPYDDNSHGTHVAGIIGAKGNNNVGSAGINWTAQLLAVKVFDENGNGTTQQIIYGIDYVLQLKQIFGNQANVRILNNSYHHPGGFDQAFFEHVQELNNSNMLFVVAAGNGGEDQIGDNNDNVPDYPANYSVANVVSVAAVNNTGELTGFSNFGAATVHLAAPGQSIYSTLPLESWGYLSGTSQAAPMVSGSAALLLSKCNLDTQALKAAILDNVDQWSSLSGKTITGGRLNVYRSLRSCAQEPNTSYYSVVVLPKPNGTFKVDARDINNYGQVTGTIFAMVPRRSYTFTTDSGLVFTPDNGIGTEGRAINDAGWVAGEVGVNQPGFLYRPDTGLIQFSQFSLINGMNNAGQIIGSTTTGPAIRNLDGSINVLPISGSADDINNFGEIAIYQATSPRRSFVYNSRTDSSIELPNAGYGPRIWALNNTGLAVGRVTVGDDPFDRCFIYSRYGGYSITPASSEGFTNICIDINDEGTAVGYTESILGGGGFVYDRINGRRFLTNMIDPSLGYTITRTWGINNSGQIIADARFPNSTTSAVLLIPSQQTPAGNSVQVQTGSVAISFSQITGEGQTFVGPLPLPPSSQLPNNYLLTGSSLAYDISTSATFTGTNRVCFNLPSIADEATFNRMKLLHFENGSYVDRTISKDFSSLEICADVTSFSPFVTALAPVGPTAAEVSVSGRIVSDQSPISRADIRLIGENRSYSAKSNTFGYFRFDGIASGQTYVIEINHKRFRFSPRVLNVTEAVDNLEFTPVENY